MDRRTVRNMYSFMPNKFVKLVHLVGFIIKKFVTMHGHMNVKFVLTSLRYNLKHFRVMNKQNSECYNTYHSKTRFRNEFKM